ncbi:MAG: tripartite tricarboxylate transporter substrate binding protein [Rhodocyclaceae bacterium]|jgi:tripartite-type tricarboxylate transporter receptor subunit TctC|nr:tripartite tricarboxylate transporter substrate binding protein [Rhodocyclaceae bacterium]
MKISTLSVATCMALTMAAPAAYAQWQPTKAIEIVVPFSPGGASDQMARVVQAIITKNNLIKQPIVIQNKAGASGAEGLIDVASDKGNPHKIIVASTAIYTVPLASSVPFNWRDLNPIAMIAQDQFVLWVNASSPYTTVKEYIAAAKQKPEAFRMGGTSSKREDQVITAQMEQATGAKFTYIPYKGGGEVSTQLVGKHLESCTNNPSESVAQWRANQLRALCVFDSSRIGYKTKITETQAWSDIPTCKEAGLDVQYTMLRGIFMPTGVTAEQTKFYVDLFAKIVATPEWKEYLEKNALKQEFVTGEAFNTFLAKDENRHREIMKAAGFLKQ